MKNKFLFSILFAFLIIPAYAASNADPTALYNKGIDLYEQDKIVESIAAFKEAISLDPNFYEAYYNLARVQESANMTQDAISTYEKLLMMAPDDYESTYQFGEFLYKKGYLKKSASYLSKIPPTSEYKGKADDLIAKITKRQGELANEAKVKANQELKSSVVGSIPAPSGLVIDSKGNMYVASFSESKIIKISKDGMTKTVFAQKSSGIDGPIGLAIDSHDNIYVANYNKGDVVILDKNANAKILMYAKKPYCLNLDEKSNKIYVTEQQNNSVIAYDISEILNLKNNKETEAKTESEKLERRTIIIPEEKKSGLGVPSIIESGFTRQNPQTSITSPIMVPSSESIFEF